MNNAKVVISPNPTKTRERIDAGGNIIDPGTKQVLVPREVIPPPPVATETPPIAPVPSPVIKDDPLAEIAQAEAMVAELKKAKIRETEELLNKLKQ